MDISKERFEDKDFDFFYLKQKIAKEFGIRGTDDEIEDSLKNLLSMESEVFNNSMNYLVLKKYYECFLSDIYPLVESLVQTNKDDNQLQTGLVLVENGILRLNRWAISNALSTYCCEVNDQYLLNTLNSHEVLLLDNLKKVIETNNIFRKDRHLNKDICGKFADTDNEYNYSQSFWKEYANTVKMVLNSIDKRLEKEIPDYKNSLEIYEYHIKLYKKFNSSYNELKEEKMKCQR